MRQNAVLCGNGLSLTCEIRIPSLGCTISLQEKVYILMEANEKSPLN